MKKIATIIITILSSISIVKAQTYNSNTNLFENSYTNNLIDMAQSQIENFNNLNYIIIQNENNYYLIASKEIEITNNRITMNNTSIIQAIRTQNGYNYIYEYNYLTENQTIVNVNNIVVSNIKTNKSVSSKRYEDYKYYNTIKNIGIFVLGIVFAIFITKERNY